MMPEESERLSRIEQHMEAVLHRLDELERRSGRPGRGVEVVEPRSDDGGGTLDIAGSVRRGERTFNFKHRGSFAKALEAEPETVASVFAALGSPFRIRLLRLLLDGPQSSQELQARLEVGASGQLYHHLRELLAAGLIAQRRRGLYAIRDEVLMPVLMVFVVAPHLPGQPPLITEAEVPVVRSASGR